MPFINIMAAAQQLPPPPQGVTVSTASLLGNVPTSNNATATTAAAASFLAPGATLLPAVLAYPTSYMPATTTAGSTEAPTQQQQSAAQQPTQPHAQPPQGSTSAAPIQQRGSRLPQQSVPLLCSRESHCLFIKNVTALPVILAYFFLVELCWPLNGNYSGKFREVGMFPDTWASRVRFSVRAPSPCHWSWDPKLSAHHWCMARGLKPPRWKTKSFCFRSSYQSPDYLSFTRDSSLDCTASDLATEALKSVKLCERQECLFNHFRESQAPKSYA